MSAENTIQTSGAKRKGWLKSSLSAVGNAAANVSQTTTKAGSSIASVTNGTTSFLGKKVAAGTQSLTEKAKTATIATTNAVVQGSQVVSSATVSTASFVGSTTVKAGGSIASTTTRVAMGASSATLGAANGIGKIVELIDSNTQVEKIASLLKVDQLLPLIDKVDVVKAETQVKTLQQQYPNDTPKQIAHRIMMKKALFAGSAGAATSVAPGYASLLFTADLAANTTLQAEMIYQIAKAYGLDIKDPKRRGEVISIFGIVFGGRYAVKAGLQLFMRNVPTAGAVVGAGSNAATMYATGHVACNFYSQKTNLTSTTEAEQQDANDDCFESVFEQQLLMDQVLIHMFIAEDDSRDWEMAKLSLEKFNLSTSSFEAISSLSKLPPVESLLEKLDEYFVQSLLSQCKQVAHEDGVLTAEESRIIKLIENKLA